MIPDFDTAYRAVMTRDTRFDGQFVTAVRTTRIYCRPACPARTPYRSNVRFFPTSAAAQAAGYRACRRCLPDAAPGSPEWNVRADTVGAAMRLIGDGVVDREGVPGLADRLGYTPRHLGRLLTAELGASPLSLARARRAHTARVLLTTSSLPIGDIAFAAGFLQHPAVQRDDAGVYDDGPERAAGPREAARHRNPAPSPCGCRSARPSPPTPSSASSPRAPFPAWSRSTAAPTRAACGCRHGVGTVHLTMPDAGGSPWSAAVLRLQHLADLAPAVDRCRRLLDARCRPGRHRQRACRSIPPSRHPWRRLPDSACPVRSTAPRC